MTKKALGRGLDALINGGVAVPVSIQPPHSGKIPALSQPHTPTPTPAPVTDRDSGGVTGHPQNPGPVPAARPLGTPAVNPVSPALHRPAISQQVVPAPSRVGGAPATPSVTGIRYLGLDQIEPNRFQPRKHFDADHLAELALSIKQSGVIQPLLVRPMTVAPSAGASATTSQPRYELIAGERRWRAAREAGLTTIPVLVRQATDREALEMALIENLQRDDLDPIEEARAYQQLNTQFSMTQDQVADRVGRSRAAVANALRLLALPEEVQSWVADDRLSVGHAKAVLGLSTAEEQRLVAERVLKRNLTVRETEELVEEIKGTKSKASTDATGRAKGKTAQILSLEERLRQKLGTHVSIHHGRKKGRLEIEYYGNDDLQRLLGILGVTET